MIVTDSLVSVSSITNALEILVDEQNFHTEHCVRSSSVNAQPFQMWPHDSHKCIFTSHILQWVSFYLSQCSAKCWDIPQGTIETILLRILTWFTCIQSLRAILVRPTRSGEVCSATVSKLSLKQKLLHIWPEALTTREPGKLLASQYLG